jgi:hypothetical protein
MRTETPPEVGAEPSAWRAWCYLVWLSWRRQARLRQLLGIALVLLAFAVALVALGTARGNWTMKRWRFPFRQGPTTVAWVARTQGLVGMQQDPGAAFGAAVLGGCGGVLSESGFLVFARFTVFNVFVSFLLPVLSLSFATDALGGEREGNTLVWLLTRPLPRPAVYLAKFVALLPWSLALNVGGFALLCAAAGPPGLLALRLFWPAVAWSTLAFSALFCLMGAFFRRPAIVGLVYAFFLEVLFGNLPGYLKRVSIGFYTRCMMFEVAQDYGLQPEKPSIYLPVDGPTAQAVLAVLTVVLVVAGTVVFTRSQYHEVD